MKKTIITFLSFAAIMLCSAQTVVKMNMPPQAKDPLQVIVLFDEEVPEGMPVVLGLMGYSVSGGMTPYTYEWMQNGKVIGTGDVVIVTPAKGDKIELKATDKNKCYSTMAFSLKVISRSPGANTQKNDSYTISPTLVKNGVIHIGLPDAENKLKANVRIFDTNGTLKHQSFITGSSDITFGLPTGNYFVSVQTDDFHKVEKIIVQ
ncbi:MAG: T9SS type A sorting domain-containing protein [Bacteroidia bacterium]|nr:T9SS type A sorting domain-containing protein [Bacteroidia bacterium]